jgi:hypothetical protein
MQLYGMSDPGAAKAGRGAAVAACAAAALEKRPESG